MQHQRFQNVLAFILMKYNVDSDCFHSGEENLLPQVLNSHTGMIFHFYSTAYTVDFIYTRLQNRIKGKSIRGSNSRLCCQSPSITQTQKTFKQCTK